MHNKQPIQPGAAETWAEWHRRIEGKLELWLGGRFWLPKVTLIALAATMIFSGVPGPLFNRHGAEWEAYEEKFAQPLKDMAHHGEHGHAGKLTPRITAPFVAHAFGWSRASYLWFLALCGTLTFLLIARACHQAIGCRLAAFWFTILAAGLFAGNLPFNSFTGHYDSLAILLLVLACNIRSPLACGLIIFIGCWTDERFAPASTLVWLHHLLRHHKTPSLPVLISIPTAWIGWITSRMILASVLNWHLPGGSVGLDIAAHNINWLPLVTWQALETGWLVWASALIVLWRTNMRVCSLLFLAGTCLILLCGYVVVDLSRSLSYLLPILCISAAACGPSWATPGNRRLLALCAIAALIIPNYDVIPGRRIEWTPNAFGEALLQILYVL